MSDGEMAGKMVLVTEMNMSSKTSDTDSVPVIFVATNAGCSANQESCINIHDDFALKLCSN